MDILSGLLPFFLALLLRLTNEPKPIGQGIHPAVATDPTGGVHIVYGNGQTLRYATLSAAGEPAGAPVLVDSLPGLFVGASRGPQIAANSQSVVITAIDKMGNVLAYVLDRSTGGWQKRIPVTDVPEVAKEGFIALTTGPGNTYNAVWLDLRGNQRNKLVGARSVDGGRSWSANRVLYESPSGTVCQCCQVSMVHQGQQVSIMFRNFLNGARDMYILPSTDGGQTFGKALKLGQGTWPLDACPMDGGGLFVDRTGRLSTVWRRNDTLFTARPGQREREIGIGKNPKLVSTATGDWVVFQRGGQIWAVTPASPQPKAIGPGAYPKLALLADNRVLCLWEQTNTIRAQIIPR